MTSAMQPTGDWVVKESRSHKGAMYRYNPKTGQTEWLTTANGRLPVAAPMPSGKGTAPTAAALCALDSTGGTNKGHGRRPFTRSSHATQVSWGTEDTADGSECICTICECGKHACPIHGRVHNTNPFAGNSRYREDYPAHPLRPRDRKLVKKTAMLSPSDPDQFKSKYAEDYLPLNAEPPQSMRPKANVPVTGPFEGVTTNRLMHDAKPIVPQSARRPPSPPRDSGPFEGTTTNREVHRPFPGAAPRECLVPPQRRLASAPFDGMTQYKCDYLPHEASPYRRQRAAHEAYDYGPNRNLETEQRTAFTPKPIKYCPVLDLDPKDPSGHTGHIHYTKHERPTFKYFPGKPTGETLNGTLSPKCDHGH